MEGTVCSYFSFVPCRHNITVYESWPVGNFEFIARLTKNRTSSMHLLMHTLHGA